MKDFHALCKAQVLRFAGRLGWTDPKENPAPARDLVQALERCSRGSQDFARRVVDSCVEASQYCPTVPDILRVAQEFRDQEPKPITGCNRCEHTGWIQIEKGGYDYSAPCSCRAKPEPKPKPHGMTSAADVRMRAAGDEAEREY